MAELIALMRSTTPAERRRRSPTLHGEGAYKERTGMTGVLLPGKLLDPGNGLDNVGTWRHAIRVPNHLTRKEVRRLLVHTFGRVGGCGHDYDCCGCANAFIHWDSVRRIRRGQFSFVITHTRNY